MGKEVEESSGCELITLYKSELEEIKFEAMNSAYTKEELDLFRQWFNAVQDLNNDYLKESDYALYAKVLRNIRA